MTYYTKDTRLTVGLTIFKDSLGKTKYDESDLCEIVEKLLEGDFDDNNLTPTESKSPFLVNHVHIHEIDDEWIEK